MEAANTLKNPLLGTEAKDNLEFLATVSIVIGISNVVLMASLIFNDYTALYNYYTLLSFAFILPVCLLGFVPNRITLLPLVVGLFVVGIWYSFTFVKAMIIYSQTIGSDQIKGYDHVFFNFSIFLDYTLSMLYFTYFISAIKAYKEFKSKIGN